MSKKNFLEQRVVDRREFNYSKANVSLVFTLRTDVKTELKDFKECLDQARYDVDALLKSFEKTDVK